ncbi:MAG: SGNH/GDSL hydrolase family protein [Clostridia bacterium]|nr:SGNH/GDSL hydrolase family protein [Clostridia bacterium]
MKNLKDLKITIFGDSIGKGVATDNGKIEVLKDNAVELFEKTYSVKVDNRSVFGQSLKRIMQRGVIDKYIQNLNPNENSVAVLEIGGNDSDFNWREVSNSPQTSHQPNTPIDEFSFLYSSAIDKLKNAGVKVVVCTIVPIDSKRFFDNFISKQADKDKILQFFKGDYNTIHRHQEMFNNEIIKNAYQKGCKIIDLRKKFLDTNVFDDLMCLDGIHPNGDGHAEIYSAISDFLVTA